MKAARISFNPRPRTRANANVVLLLQVDKTFQSTPPHEGEPGGNMHHVLSPWFQSTPPHEGERTGAGRLIWL